MIIKQIEKTYQLTFLARLFPINCYLIEKNESLTLIDTRIGFGIKSVLRAAQSIDKQPITKIILTHPHGDHIGGLSKLKVALPQALNYISRWMSGDLSLRDDEPQSPIKGSFLKTNETADTLDVNDYVGSLRAISALGHTTGSMAFYLERSYQQ